MPDAREWILEAIDDRVDADDPWTSRRQLRSEARKSSTDVDVDEFNAAFAELIDDLKIVYWHGWVTHNEDELLNAVLREEAAADVTRSLLVGKVNKVKAGAWDPNPDVVDDENRSIEPPDS